MPKHIASSSILFGGWTLALGSWQCDLFLSPKNNYNRYLFIAQIVLHCTFQVWKWKHWSFHRVHLFATPWTGACQAPLSVGFSRQEYCSGLPFPSPEVLLDPGVKTVFPALQAGSLLLSHQGSPHFRFNQLHKNTWEQLNYFFAHSSLSFLSRITSFRYGSR